MSHIYDDEQIFPVKSVVLKIQNSMKNKQIENAMIACNDKPKLRTFVTFKDFKSISPHMTKPLSFIERKMISKLRLGSCLCVLRQVVFQDQSYLNHKDSVIVVPKKLSLKPIYFFNVLGMII